MSVEHLQLSGVNRHQRISWKERDKKGAELEGMNAQWFLTNDKKPENEAASKSVFVESS